MTKKALNVLHRKILEACRDALNNNCSLKEIHSVLFDHQNDLCIDISNKKSKEHVIEQLDKQYDKSIKHCLKINLINKFLTGRYFSYIAKNKTDRKGVV